MYWKLNKQSKKNLKNAADRIIGYDKTVNPHWKESWKYVIKRQFPWYGILELNQYKISEMYEYVKNSATTDDKITAKELNQMQQILDIGWKLLEYDYDSEWSEWNKKNSRSGALIYEKLGEKPLKDTGMLSKITVPVSGKLLAKVYCGMFDELLGENWEENWPDDSASKKERKKFIKRKKETAVSRWLDNYNKTADEMNKNLDEEHQVKKLGYKDITLQYFSEWTNGKSDEENRKIGKELLAKSIKECKKDKKRYFGLIAKYYSTWGD